MMPDSADYCRWLVAAGADERSTNGKLVHRTCVLPAAADGINNALKICMNKLMRHKSLPASVNARDVAGWAFAAPLHSLTDSLALACFQRVLRSRGAFISSTHRNPQMEIVALVYNDYSANSGARPSNADNAETTGSEINYSHLSKWKEVLSLGHGVEVEIRDLLAEPAATEPIAMTASRMHAVDLTRNPSVVAEELSSENVNADGIDLAEDSYLVSTVAITAAGEELEDDANTNNDEVNEAISQHAPHAQSTPAVAIKIEQTTPVKNQAPMGYVYGPRRSLRVAILESIIKPEPVTPAPPPPLPPRKRRASMENTFPQNKKSRFSKKPLFPSGKPAPKGPFEVVCGTATGLWDPKFPMEIQIKDASLPRGKQMRVIPGYQFEKLGGKGGHKKWKDSVRVILPGVSQNRSVARVAMELGMPIVKDPRGGAEAIKIEDCSDQEEYLKRLRDAKCSIITNTAMRVGYSEENIRKRMASERTFRAKHRPEAPDYIDWHLLLPAGVWVRSLDDILRHPMRTDFDEDDVILTDDDEAYICTRFPRCFRRKGHEGGCIQQRAPRSAIRVKQEPGTSGRRSGRADHVGDFEKDAWVRKDYLENLWDGCHEHQQAARQERWKRRQGGWDGDFQGTGIKEEESAEDRGAGVVNEEGLWSVDVSLSSIALGFSSDNNDEDEGNSSGDGYLTAEEGDVQGGSWSR